MYHVSSLNLSFIFSSRARRSPSPPSTRTIEEVAGSDKLMGPPLEGGYNVEVMMKGRNSSLVGPPMSPYDEDTMSVREYKSRGGAEMAHVHVTSTGTYGRGGTMPHTYPTGTIGRQPSHLYESPKFS